MADAPEFVLVGPEGVEVHDPTGGYPRWTRTTFRREDTELVLLFSDGISSFQLKDGTPIPLEQVLDQVFDLKGFAGQFLTRRCTRFLQKFCAENGWQHADDFSVGGLHLGAP